MASEKSRYYYGKCLVLHLRPRLPYMVYGATFCVVYTTLYLSTALVVDMCVDISTFTGVGGQSTHSPTKSEQGRKSANKAGSGDRRKGGWNRNRNRQEGEISHARC